MQKDTLLETYKSHIKDIEKVLQTNKFWAFGDDFFHVFKKTERLTVAIYIISDFFNQDEQLMSLIRNESFTVLSFILSVPLFLEEKDGEAVLAEAKAKISKLLLLLETAVCIRAISPMNFFILRDEYLALLGSLRLYLGEDRERRRRALSFPEGFFKEEQSASAAGIQEKKNNNTGSRVADTTDSPHEPPRKRHDSVKDKYKGHIKKDIKDTYSEKHLQKTTLSSKKSRRETIVQLLKTRGELNIKDISAVLPHWSEKTIQREIVSLIKEGAVERHGARRWSTYVALEEVREE